MHKAHAAGAMAGYTAGLLQIVAFLIYGYQMVWMGSQTNPVSWWLWLAETFVGLLIYADRTGDRAKWVAEFASLLGVIFVNLYIVWRMIIGDAAIVLERVEHADIVSGVLAVCVFIFWVKTRDRIGAGPSMWIFQIPLLVAAYPLIRAAYADPSLEPFIPWALWTASFALQLVSAILRWDGWEPLVNPMNYMLTHGVIAFIIWYGVAPH